MDYRPVRSLLLSVLFLAYATPGCNEEPAPAAEEPPPSCPPGTMLDYSETCVPEACGYGRWGDLDVAGDTVFVDAIAALGGDGTEDLPLTSIQDALDLAGDRGAMVAVAAGTYRENLVLESDNNGVHLAGRCREAVLLDASHGEEDEAGILADGLFGTEAWRVSGITVTGAPYVGIRLEYGQLTVQRSAVAGNGQIGVLCWHSSSLLRMSDVHIEDTFAPGMGSFGRGLHVQGGGRVQAENCRIQGNTETGVVAGDAGTVVQLVGVEVLDTQPLGSGNFGRGLSIQGGATLWAEDCRIEGNTDIAIAAVGAGSELHLKEVAIRETELNAAGTNGRGIVLQEAAALFAEDCWIEDNSEGGIFLSDVGTTAHLSRVDVTGTRSAADGTGGWGISVQSGARLEAEGCRIEDNGEHGIFVGHEGSVARLHDVVVKNTHPLADEFEDTYDGTYGRGIVVQEGASLYAEDCWIEDNSDVGIYLASEGTTAHLVGVDVIGTRVPNAGIGGRGIVVQNSAFLIAEDCRVEDNAETGISVGWYSAEAHLIDVTVTNTRRPPESTMAIGILCQAYSSLQATDVRVERTEGIGLYVVHYSELSCRQCDLQDNAFAGAVVLDQGLLDLSETTILDTAADANEGGGVGVFAADTLMASNLRIRDVHVEGQPLAALWIEGEGFRTVEDSVLVGGTGETVHFPDGSSEVLHGDAVVVTGGARELYLVGNTIRDAPRAGVLIDDSSATLSGNTFEGNGTDLVWQNCGDSAEPVVLGEVGSYELRCDLSSLPVAPLDLDLWLDEGEVED
jgi:hypothetical protein